MARTTMMSVRAATVCLLLLLAAASAASAANVKSRDLLGEDAGSTTIPKLSDEKPPDGHLSYRIVKGILEKASGRSARVDLERGKEEKLKPLLSIP